MKSDSGFRNTVLVVFGLPEQLSKHMPENKQIVHSYNLL